MYALSQRSQVGRFLFLFPQLLVTNIKAITNNRIKPLSMNILKIDYGFKCSIFQHLKVNLTFALRWPLTILVSLCLKALILCSINSLMTFFKQKFSHFVIICRICLYLHFSADDLLGYLCCLCDFSKILCTLFHYDPFNYKVWRSLSPERAEGVLLKSKLKTFATNCQIRKNILIQR